MPNTAPLPPMASGLFGYLGYDMIRHVEKVPDNNPALLGVFDTVLMRPSVIAIFDRLKDSITLAVPIRPARWASPTEAWNDAKPAWMKQKNDFMMPSRIAMSSPLIRLTLSRKAM